MAESKLPNCHGCGAKAWVHIPDSLAKACDKCGAVIVRSGGGDFEVGTSLQEWAAYLAERHTEIEANRGEEEE